VPTEDIVHLKNNDPSLDLGFHDVNLKRLNVIIKTCTKPLFLFLNLSLGADGLQPASTAVGAV